MNTEKIFLTKPNGAKVPCICNIPESCEKIVIIIHGICSCKESDNAQFLLDFMPQHNIGAIAYDQPAHGSEEAYLEELKVKNCLDSLATVENYVAKNFPSKEICYFGSSFGAYILGLYLALENHKGTKAFMRCAAVNFPDLILKNPMSKSLLPTFESLKPGETKDLDLGLGDTVKAGSVFFRDIKKYSLTEIYENKFPENVKLAFAHGENDPVVPVKSVKTFAIQHNCPITIFEKEDHSISTNPDSPTEVANLALQHFNF